MLALLDGIVDLLEVKKTINRAYFVKFAVDSGSDNFGFTFETEVFEVVDSFFRRFLDGDYICSLLKVCNDTTEYETIDDYAKKILGNKPPIKEREIVERKNDDNRSIRQDDQLYADLGYRPVQPEVQILHAGRN